MIRLESSTLLVFTIDEFALLAELLDCDDRLTPVELPFCGKDVLLLSPNILLLESFIFPPYSILFVIITQ